MKQHPPACTGRDDCTVDTHTQGCTSALRRLQAQRDTAVAAALEFAETPIYGQVGPVYASVDEVQQLRQQLAGVRQLLRNETRRRQLQRHGDQEMCRLRYANLYAWCRALTIAVVCLLVLQIVLALAVFA